MPNSKDSNSRSVFDLTDAEEKARLQAVTDKLKKELYAKGLPMVYQDSRCPSENHFIREFEDGRVQLVLLDIPNRNYIFVKDLGNA
jgi:hypothetical protein